MRGDTLGADAVLHESLDLGAQFDSLQAWVAQVALSKVSGVRASGAPERATAVAPCNSHRRNRHGRGILQGGYRYGLCFRSPWPQEVNVRPQNACYRTP